MKNNLSSKKDRKEAEIDGKQIDGDKDADRGNREKERERKKKRESDAKRNREIAKD
jgi:hypothetical protein